MNCFQVIINQFILVKSLLKIQNFSRTIILFNSLQLKNCMQSFQNSNTFLLFKKNYSFKCIMIN